MKEKTFERKNELMEAALEEFTVKSFDEASLNTIIKSAGISKGTFYYHFEDKQALYLYLLESSVKTKWDFINGRVGEYTSEMSGKDIFDRFKLQAKVGVEFALAYPKYYKLSRMLIKEKGKPIYDITMHVLRSGAEAILEKQIQSAMEAGDFRKEFTKDFLVRVMTYLFNSFYDIFIKEDDDYELEKTLQNLNLYVNFLKFGLGA